MNIVGHWQMDIPCHFRLKYQVLGGFLAVLLFISCSAGAARTQETIGAYRGPIFLAVDGISNVINECFFRGSKPRSEPYLAPELSERWGLYVQTVDWSGSLHDTARYEQFLVDLRDKLKELLLLENQLVVIAHSWGSIAVYLALREIDLEIAQGSFVQARKKNLFVTLGSPLEKASLFGRAESCWPGHVKGRDYIRASGLKIPDSFTYWLNFPVLSDEIANQSITFARNIAVPTLLSKTAFNSHSDYYKSSITARAVLHNVAAFLDSTGFHVGSTGVLTGNKCPNLVLSPQTLPVGYGAPFNFFDRRMALSLEAVCAGGSSPSVSLIAGHNDPQQYTYERGFRWDGRTWRPFQFKGANRVGSWVMGRADAAVGPKDFASQRPNWFIAYTCHKDEQGKWRCGCQGVRCQVGRWQAQGFIGP